MPEQTLTSKELLHLTLNGHEHNRVPSGPLAVQYCAALKGISIRDYTYNPEAMADSIIHYYNTFKPDAVWISNDTWVTAEAMGAAVGFPDDQQPLCGTGAPLIRQTSDIERIPPADIYNQGRCAIMLEAHRLVTEELGDSVFVVGCFDQSPFSLACHLLGAENAMEYIITDLPMVNALLDRCIEYITAYALAIDQTGVDMLSTGDAPAGLLGKDLYSTVALPAEQRVFSYLREHTNTFLSLHICGNVSHILEKMTEAGADILEIDSLVDLGRACQIVSPDITLWGNLDPVGLLEQSSKKNIENELQNILNILQKYKRSRFVLSSGCGLTMDTNEDNLHLLCRSINMR